MRYAAYLLPTHRFCFRCKFFSKSYLCSQAHVTLWELFVAIKCCCTMTEFRYQNDVTKPHAVSLPSTAHAVVTWLPLYRQFLSFCDIAVVCTASLWRHKGAFITYANKGETGALCIKSKWQLDIGLLIEKKETESDDFYLQYQYFN